MAIGSLNLLAGLITTVGQFLKISELTEGHRVAAIGFAKLSRSIRTTLSLPTLERPDGGHQFVEACRQEYDRLIEQSPFLPQNIITSFARRFRTENFAKPEIIVLSEVNIFKEQEMDYEHERTINNLKQISYEMKSIRDLNLTSDEADDERK